MTIETAAKQIDRIVGKQFRDRDTGELCQVQEVDLFAPPNLRAVCLVCRDPGRTLLRSLDEVPGTRRELCKFVNAATDADLDAIEKARAGAVGQK